MVRSLRFRRDQGASPRGGTCGTADTPWRRSCPHWSDTCRAPVTKKLMIEVWELPVVHTSGLHLHLDYPLLVLPLLLSSLSVRLDVFFQFLLNFWWSWCYQNSKLIAVLNLQINTYLHHRYEKPIHSLTLALDLRTCSISSCWSAFVVIFTFHSGPQRKFPLSPSHSEMTVSWGKILTQWNGIWVKYFLKSDPDYDWKLNKHGKCQCPPPPAHCLLPLISSHSYQIVAGAFVILHWHATIRKFGVNIKPYHFILQTAGWLTFSLRDQVKYGFALNTMFNFTIGKSWPWLIGKLKSKMDVLSVVCNLSQLVERNSIVLRPEQIELPFFIIHKQNLYLLMTSHHYSMKEILQK